MTARSASPAPTGKRTRQVRCPGYREYVAERVEPWSYLKFPYLKKIGWKGFVDGAESGVYKATPLSRLNAADGMATPLAQAEYKRMYETLGGKPIHHTLATHWARLIELLVRRRALGGAGRRSRRSPARNTAYCPRRPPTEGVGCVEAPRGTLTHHYWTDRARHPHQGEPDRRHDQQQCPHLHVGQEGGPRADHQGPGAPRDC